MEQRLPFHDVQLRADAGSGFDAGSPPTTTTLATAAAS